jgi:hypothetical protein
MEAVIIRTKVKRKDYGRITSYTTYDIEATDMSFRSGIWNLNKIKKHLMKKGYTEFTVSDRPDCKLNY